MIRLALAALVLAGALAGWQALALKAARAELAAVQGRLAGYEEAARFWAAEQRRRTETAATDRQLQEGTGANAGLSDYLRGAAGRVWP